MSSIKNISFRFRMSPIVTAYIILAVCLLLFSYTQVDLNLTLSRVSVWQEIQKSFQHIGYYNRPLSTFFYVGIIVAMYGLYGYLVHQAYRERLRVYDIWKIIIFVVIILACSYPAAFSYDYFNYMFTAKTVLVYHKNPYSVIPLYFAPIDSWTNFMRWTHLSSAYTPVWIFLSLFPYVIGLGYFLTVLFGIKLLIIGFYLLACIYLMRVQESEQKQYMMISLVSFALNPLVIIETLVSGHNDIVMIAFVFVALWFLYRKRYLTAWWYITASVAAKFMTIFLLPVFFFHKKRMWLFSAMCVGLAFVLTRREFLPWYGLWILPFASLVPEKKNIMYSVTVLSFALLLSYAPHLYFGDYSSIEQQMKFMIIWVGVGCSSLCVFLDIIRTWRKSTVPGYGSRSV